MKVGFNAGNVGKKICLGKFATNSVIFRDLLELSGKSDGTRNLLDSRYPPS